MVLRTTVTATSVGETETQNHARAVTSEHDQAVLILSHQELCAVTGRSRYRAQSRALARMGISHRLRPDGFPIVSRAHFEAIMGSDTALHPPSATQPNWAALDAA